MGNWFPVCQVLHALPYPMAFALAEGSFYLLCLSILDSPLQVGSNRATQHSPDLATPWLLSSHLIGHYQCNADVKYNILANFTLVWHLQ